jgi:hypothetical protein
MRIVLNSAQPARAAGFSDLIRNTCATAKELDLINIRSRLISIMFINKATALHLLQGNLATEGVTLLNNKANSINLSLFLPQQNTSMIDRERSNDLTACSENNMDIADTHKSKANVAIIHISTMVNMTDFSSLCINCNTIISAIVHSSGPQPFYRQILLKFVNLMNNPDFNAWYAANKGSMPSPHWHVYSFLKHIFNLFTKFATDFGNANVLTELGPLAELNTKPLVKALTVLKAFVDQLTLAQSTNSPIPILAATVSKFSTRGPGTNSNVGTPAPAPVYASALPENTQNQCRNVKRDPSTQDESTKVAAIQRQKKKPRRNGATNPAKQRHVTEMGMFFLTKHNIKAIDIFPKDLPTKICANFTCKGRKCTRENCPYSHPRNARELTAETIAKIIHHFSSKNVGWLNEWHFMKLAHLPADVKVLVGGKDGPSSSKRA